VLSGDNHNNWAFDVKRNFDDEKSAVVATEFAGMSITSGGDGADIAPSYAGVLGTNPQVRFHNSRRGYVRCEVTPDRWHTDFRTVPYVTRPASFYLLRQDVLRAAFSREPLTRRMSSKGHSQRLAGDD
jgi:alkaline phosphatase D